jgi:hypothetical protein
MMSAIAPGRPGVGRMPRAQLARGLKFDGDAHERLIGCSEPLPNGVLSVPFATYFQELPW